MVGRLHTSSASNHQYPNPPSSNGSFTSLDLHVLSRIASSGPQQSSATAAVPLTLAEAPPDVCSTSSPTHPGLDYQAVLKLLQTPTQPGQTAVLKEALDQFLSASRHSNPLSLVSLLAQRLAEGELWDELQRLLDTIPSGTSQGCLLPGATCSWILPTAARAQRYRLLSPLCSCLDDASPDQVVEALAVLLQPTTASNLTLRKAHFMNIRSHAEAAIAQSERAISSLPGNSSRHRALALAKCAAAVVDGFTAQEVLIHPLLAMPLDVPALQGRLAELNNYHVDRLLSYLAKWMDKYTQELGDVAAQIPLPVELLFPTLTQVLEWVRLLLDSHLARLLMAQQTLPCLGQITSCVNLQVCQIS
ncbi:hypothetical protein CEUSTIGMA_g10915.t1 [Chlamydomonas eustigma]|uniref:Nucleolar protein 11 C-terminal domain-containing protein n=1 Tax=Chlamydomonas eustigma TaxID=1157962 RepID=A0A250XL26_9CHLO|nr:hypothetical protein CEUSTIGMA_g10915.t1 [Chlamydomonas eustigma]|eukprot:GAX83490.1 hypothetical protein CEUSTIGMA_g10915.t1 [Chlamydomonas eustigma]